MKKLEINKKYICENCKKFLFKLDEDGYIRASKNKGFAMSAVVLKITCMCGKEYKYIK